MTVGEQQHSVRVTYERAGKDTRHRGRARTEASNYLQTSSACWVLNSIGLDVLGIRIIVIG